MYLQAVQVGEQHDHTLCLAGCFSSVIGVVCRARHDLP